jgi:hypothetical protein
MTKNRDMLGLMRTTHADRMRTSSDMRLMPDLTKSIANDPDEDPEHLEVPAGTSPLDFLCAIFCDARQPMHRRLRAAIEAAPYVHSKLSAVAVGHMSGEDFASRLERAIERSRVRPKLIEAEKISAASLLSADVAK